MFTINSPERFEIKSQNAIDFGGKTVAIKFMYLNFSESMDLSLDLTIAEVLAKVKPFVKRNEEYDEAASILKLVYRGKVLTENSKLGAYVKGNDLIQVFRTLKA